MSFSIIKHFGRPDEALTEKGVKVTRQERIFVPEWGAFVTCADYDNHFVYENPDKSEGSPAHLCTCGSIAMVRGAGPKGTFVCMTVEQFGEHTTTFYNLKDIDTVAGKVLDVDGKRVKVRDKK